MKKPYQPQATLEQMIAFDPANPATYTSSPLLNAVLEAIDQIKAIECRDVANYLDIDPRKLSSAVEIECGLSCPTLIQQLRLAKVKKYIEEHPEANLDQVARDNGYASDGSLWRLFQRKLGQTPYGDKSEAGTEKYNEMVKKSRSRK